LKVGESPEPSKEQMMSPAERYLMKERQSDNTKPAPPVHVVRAGGSVAFKVLAVVVFAIMILIGTYFAKVSGPPILGYIIGAAAFLVSPLIWNARRT
jgi:hypothetical protein